MRLRNFITSTPGKTLLVLLTVLLLFFSMGCQKNEQPVYPKIPLVFSAAADELPSKASLHTPMMGIYDTDESFSVFAAFSKTSFDKDDPSTYENFWYSNTNPIKCDYYSKYNAWAPSDALGQELLYYWPLIGTLTFQAYSPADLGTNATTVSHTWDEGFKFTNFVVPGVGAQYDLMYSTRTENCRRSDYYIKDGEKYDDDNDRTGYPYKGINIDFKHALSAVEIQAISSLGSNSSIKFRVKNVSLVNAYDTGNFSQIGESWTIDTGHTANPYNLLEPDVWKDPLPGTNDYETEYPVAPALILLPQNLDHDGVDGFNASHDVYISLTYEKYEGTTVLGGETITWPLPLSYTEEVSGGTPVVTTGWQRSRKYTYRFVFSDHIEFEARISPWEEATRGHYVIVQ